MSDYGDNFEFLHVPEGSSRDGRFITPAAPAAVIPIGAPIMVDTSLPLTTDMSMQPVKLATHALARVAGAGKGIAVYEWGPAAFAGDDPYLTTYSQKSFVPAGAAVQMIHGDPSVKVRFANTVAHRMLGVGPQRTGRKMVSGIGATPLVAVGDFLVPGLGNDSDGYWEATADETVGWLEITLVDAARLVVEARMLF